MSFISVFDVLGPNMIGPSSSHTAGAARIAYLAQKMINGPLVRVDFTLYGSFARTYRGHGTDRALLGGIMGFDTDDMRIRDSFRIAEEKGIPYQLEIMGGTTGTDADGIGITKGGVRCALLSIPQRNMHTPCEIVDIEDIENTARLMAEYVKGVR